MQGNHNEIDRRDLETATLTYLQTSTWAASTIVASFGNGRKLTSSHHGAMARSPSVRNDRDIRSRDPDILHPREIRNTLTNVGCGRLDTSSCSLIARVWELSRNTVIESRCPNSLRIVSETLLQTRKGTNRCMWTTIQSEFAEVFTKGTVMLVRALMRNMCKVLADSESRYLHLEMPRRWMMFLQSGNVRNVARRRFYVK